MIDQGLVSTILLMEVVRERAKSRCKRSESVELSVNSWEPCLRS